MATAKFEIHLFANNRNGGEESKVSVEIIQIKSDKISMFEELQQTLIQRLEHLQKPDTSITIFWEDDDDDRIDIKDQCSLVIAMKNMGGPVYKIFVVFENNDKNG